MENVPGKHNATLDMPTRTNKRAATSRGQMGGELRKERSYWRSGTTEGDKEDEEEAREHGEEDVEGRKDEATETSKGKVANEGNKR